MYVCAYKLCTHLNPSMAIEQCWNEHRSVGNFLKMVISLLFNTFPVLGSLCHRIVLVLVFKTALCHFCKNYTIKSHDMLDVTFL